MRLSILLSVKKGIIAKKVRLPLNTYRCNLSSCF